MSNVNVNCLDIIKGNDALEKHFESITDLSDIKQREKAIELAKGYYESLHKELELFKKSIIKDYKTKKFVAEDTTAKVAAVKEKFAPKESNLTGLTPKAGDQVVIPSKQTKGVITYVKKDDGWYFKDSKGKWQKETAANQGKLDDQWRAAQGVQKEVSAYHGSPHSFQKFTTEKTGTGEGAQAFGWGLYFTDLVSIARGYAKALTKQLPSFNGKTLNILSVERKFGKNKISIRTLDLLSKAISSVDGIATKQDLINYVNENTFDFDKERGEALALIEGYNDGQNLRNLYKVSLHKGKTPDQYTWLEWDKTVPKSVSEKIEAKVDSMEDGFLKDELSDELAYVKDSTGEQLYKRLTKILENEKEASLFLLDAGVDGVKYPAESIARGATSDNARGFNYVVFDENAVTIEEKAQFDKGRMPMEGGASVDVTEYVDKARNVLQALFPDAKFEVYETNAEYKAATGDTEGRGSYNPKTKTVALNLQKMREDAVTKTPIHEVIHPIVRAAIQTDEYALNNMWQSLLELENIPGMELVWRHVANYEPSQQAEEGITEFITRVVDGSIRLDQIPKSLADKVIDLINKIFKAIGIGVELGSAADLRRLSEAVKKAFETGDVSAVAKLIGADKNPSMGFALMKENGKFNLQKIADYAKQIIEGTRIFERFSQGEQRGIASGGEIHAEASILLSTNEGTSGKNITEGEAQENRIEQYAKQKGIWIDDTTASFTKKYGEPIGAGEEAIVWGNPKNGTVVKTQDTFQYDNLQQKLDGITLHNTYFPAAPLKVIGFGRNAKGEFQVIVEQPFVQGEKLSISDIRDYVESIGLKYDAENDNYRNSEIILEDLHTGNVIKDKDGNIIVIDPVMRLNTPEQGYGGSRGIGGKLDASILRDKGRSALNKWLKQVINEYPDTTVEEAMEAIEEDAPKLVDTPEKKDDVRKRIEAIINPQKPTQNAVQERKPTQVPVGEAPADSGKMGKGDAQREEATQEGRAASDEEKGVKPPKPPKEKAEAEGSDLLAIKHADTAKAAEELGLAPYEKTSKSNEELDAAANAQIAKGVDLDAMIDKLMRGIPPNDVGTVILAKYHALLKKNVDDNPTNENINRYDRLRTALDAIGSVQGRAFALRKQVQSPEISLADYLVRQKQESGVDVLTDEQIRQNKEEFEQIQKAAKEWEDKYNELLQQQQSQAAQEEVNNQRKTTKRNKAKTREDFKKERQLLKDKIKEKLAKMRGQTSVIILPYADRLVAIAPEVALLTKSYVEQGIVELADIVRNIREDLRDEIPEITDADVTAIIAGEYNEKKHTRNETIGRLNQLRVEAKLLAQIEALERGEEPSSEIKKIERNQRIKELKDKLKTYPAYNLAQEKKKLQSEIAKLEKDLQDGNFAPEVKKPRIKLDAEARRLKDKLVELKTKREVRLLKEAYEKRTTRQKMIDVVIKAANVPRTIMASMDYSAPFRQAIIPTISNPKMAAKAFVEMFRASFSKKRFDEWFFDLENDPRYDIMREFGLGIADPKNPHLIAKEEAFMSGYVEQMEQFVGKKLFNKEGVGLVSASERAYVMYLNKMRVDLFNRMVDQLESNGKFPDTDEEAYKQVVKYVNAVTGRGSMGALEQAAPILNVMMFSPRLIASRLSLLFEYPVIFRKLPSEIKKQYAFDMLKFIGAGAAVLGAAYAMGGGDDKDDVSIELDPRSTDFLKIRKGNTRWDIWGGFQQYVRFISQFISGQKKTTTTDEIKELNGEGAFGEDRGDVAVRFIRGKLAPIPSTVINLAAGTDIIGNESTVKSELIKSVIPLLAQSIYEAAKDDGIKGALSVGVPSVFGIGAEVQGYRDRKISGNIRFEGKTAVLTEKQKEVFEKNLNVATIKALDRVKELPEYKKATKKERANMETAVKEMVLDVMKKDYIRKNREQLLQQVKPEDNSVKEAKQRVKGVVEGYDEGRRRPSRKRER